MQAWTDERLDDLSKKVDDGFTDVKAEFRTVRGEIGALHRLLIQTFSGLSVTMILGFAAILLQSNL